VALTGHEAPVYALESGPGQSIVSGGGDRVITRWSTDTLQPSALAQVQATVYSLRYLDSPGLLLAGTSTGILYVIDLAGGSPRALQLHRQGIFDIVASKSHSLLFTAGGDGILSAWNLDDFSPVKSLQLCQGKVRSIALRPDGRSLAVACGDGTIAIVSLPGLEYRQFSAHTLSCNAVAWHPEEDYLVSGGRDAHIRQWHPGDFSLQLEIPAHNYAVYDFSFSPGNRYLASASRDKTIKLWDAATLGFLARLDKDKSGGHVNSVNQVLWGSDGRLVSGGDDRSVLIWAIQ
jgi:WD40 repeat protein